MGQLNLHMTEEFREALERYMEERGISTKSGAIRQAVYEVLEQIDRSRQRTDFRKMIGVGSKKPENRSPRFTNDDELWEK